MRIQFVSSDRPGPDWTGPNLRIGSDSGCDLQLSGDGIAPVHAVLRRECGAAWLLVSHGAPHVYVNARPVRECAMVRAGDMLSLGAHRLLLRADAAPMPEAAGETVQARGPGTDLAIALRVVGGPCSGRVWPVNEVLQLDSSGQPVVQPGAGDAFLRVGWVEGFLQLDTLAEGRQMPSVNGVPARQARLHNGDCISLGPHRLVVDAWGLEPDPDALPPRPSVPAEPLPEDRAGPRGEVWWLILTAAVLALLIALFLVLHP